MKRSFTITNNFDRVELGDSRAVQISFTVTNETGRRVEVDLNLRADVKSLGWFSLEGGSSRLMAPKATEHVTVAINVPPKVPAQSASFHLDAASSEEPDEMFCEGPPAVLVVPPPVVRKRNIPWILIAGVMAILIMVGVVTKVRNAPGKEESDQKLGSLVVANLGAYIAVFDVQWEEIEPDGSSRNRNAWSSKQLSYGNTAKFSIPRSARNIRIKARAVAAQGVIYDGPAELGKVYKVGGDVFNPSWSSE